MWTNSPMVQKKLVDLETELTDVYRRPLDPIDPRRQMPFDDIKQRFSFLRKLIAAEIESQPETSDELSQKFAQLEAEFDNWNDSKSCVLDNPDIDALEICSQAILEEDDFSDQQSAVKVLKMDERARREGKMRKRGKYWKLLKKQRRERGERKRRENGGKDWEAFGRGMIVGGLIIWLMMNFSSSLQAGAFFLTPT
ncbi:hypothetical protein ACS0TY_022766 [Phlomoides rotata]